MKRVFQRLLRRSPLNSRPAPPESSSPLPLGERLRYPVQEESRANGHCDLGLSHAYTPPWKIFRVVERTAEGELRDVFEDKRNLCEDERGCFILERNALPSCVIGQQLAITNGSELLAITDGSNPMTQPANGITQNHGVSDAAFDEAPPLSARLSEFQHCPLSLASSLATLFQGRSAVASADTSHSFHADADEDHRISRTGSQHIFDFTRPTFSNNWQVRSVFNENGGTLQRSHSDVSLIVPPGSVGPGAFVEISSAICTDVEKLERYLHRQGQYQYVVTPMVEYRKREIKKTQLVESESHFKKPVHIKMKHCLPPDPDISLVRVYCVPEQGVERKDMTRVRHKSAHMEPDIIQLRNALMSSEALVVAEDGDDFDEDRVVAWNMNSYFELTSDGYVRITTDHFSGYICSYCGKKQPSPTLHALASGNFEEKNCGQWMANLSAHIWDERLIVEDFRKDYELKQQNVSEPTIVELLDEFEDSSHLCVCLFPGGEESQFWDHVMDRRDQPSLQVEKSYTLKQVVKCEGKKCRKRNPRPITKRWSLESNKRKRMDPWLHCVVAISHVKTGSEPTWGDVEDTERLTEVKLTMRQGLVERQRYPATQPHLHQMRLGVENPSENGTTSESSNGQPRSLGSSCNGSYGHQQNIQSLGPGLLDPERPGRCDDSCSVFHRSSSEDLSNSDVNEKHMIASLNYKMNRMSSSSISSSVHTERKTIATSQSSMASGNRDSSERRNLGSGSSRNILGSCHQMPHETQV